MKKTFNQTMPCAVHLAALLLVPAVCVAFSGCSAVPGSSGSSAAEPSSSPAAAEPAAKPDLPSLRPLYQGDENGYYTFMTAASGDYQPGALCGLPDRHPGPGLPYYRLHA